MIRARNPHQDRAFILALLWGLAVLTTCVAGLSVWMQRVSTGQASVTGKVLPDFQDDLPQVRTITITIGQGSYSLQRRGALWVMPERDDYPVSSEALSALAKDLSDLSYQSARTSDPAQFERLGVDDPAQSPRETNSGSVHITIKNASSQILHSLFLGQKGDAVFVRKAGTNDVFEAKGALPDFPRLASWLDLKVIDITAETIASVSGGRSGQARYDIVRRPDGGFAPVGGVGNVTATTAAIATTTWDPIDVMAASGLTTDPIGTHVTLLRSGVSISVTAYQERNQNWVVLSADTQDASQSDTVSQINRRTDNWAFALDQTAFENFTFDTSAVINGPANPQSGAIRQQ